MSSTPKRPLGEHYGRVCKRFGDLTARDWLSIGIKSGLTKPVLKAQGTKENLIKFIYSEKKTWLEAYDLEKDFIWFHNYDEKRGNDIVCMQTVTFDRPANAEEYKHQPAQARFFLSPERIREIFTAENDSVDMDSLNDVTFDENVSESGSSRNGASTPKSGSNAVTFRTKLKYEADTEISRFLNCVESYAKANNIQNDEGKISITITCLNQTDEGALAVNILSDYDQSTWDLFKAKLISVLGHSPDYYKAQFQSFQRGSMRLGLALSTLTESFKRGWVIRRALTTIESDMVKERFINSLEGPLRVMLKAEAPKLSLDTILSRASELENCFATDQLSVTNSISDKSPSSTPDILSILSQNHKEMMQLQNQFLKAFSGMKSDSRKPRGTMLKPLNGLCSFYAKGSECKRENCRYRHEGPVSESQKDLVKNFK